MTQKLKAYYCEEWDTGYGYIEYFENVGQAKAHFANDFKMPFVDVKPRRVPWADEYGSQDNIPAEVYFENGHYFFCSTCGDPISEMEDCFTNEDGYCCRTCYERETEEVKRCD